MPRTIPPERRIRLAVVGCGRIAERHFEAAKHHAADIEPVAVCDCDPAALARARAGTGAAGFADLDTLLASSDADLVALCTPSGLHPAQTLRCAAAGRHIMTEKPMATRWRDGTAMVHACDEADVHLFVVKQNRHNPTLQLLRRAVRKGRFGRV
jgi:UDP-N-acetyl-2-amino-2-deoxyglucuronate dehydrogenase